MVAWRREYSEFYLLVVGERWGQCHSEVNWSWVRAGEAARVGVKWSLAFQRFGSVNSMVSVGGRDVGMERRLETGGFM
jgi:hypothetical protein